MQKELEALGLALGNPARPVAAIVGGAKVSTKLDLLGNLVNKVDILIIGGGMANTFLFAEGKNVGKSLCEKDLAETARSIVAAAEKAKCRILLPVDATVAKELKAHAPAHVVDIDHVAEDEMILDIGPKSVVGVEEVLGADQDAGLERPARRLRDAALRCGDDGDRQNGRVADQGRQIEVGRGRRRHRRRAQRGQGRRRFHLRLGRRRRFPRVDGRQGAAGSGGVAGQVTEGALLTPARGGARLISSATGLVGEPPAEH